MARRIPLPIAGRRDRRRADAIDNGDDGDGIGSDTSILYNANSNQICPISMILWMGVILR